MNFKQNLHQRAACMQRKRVSASKVCYLEIPPLPSPPPGMFDPLCIPCSPPTVKQHQLWGMRGETEAGWSRDADKDADLAP